MRESLRMYLRGRRELGEPELVFSSLRRVEVLRRVRSVPEVVNAPPERAPPERSDVSAGHGPPEASAPGRVVRGPRPAGARAELARLAREATADEIRTLSDLTVLREVALGCTRCPLHVSRRQVVFGEGDANASLVCVGEAPGASEDETGRPFVGRAGRLLDRLLLSVGFPRESVYICNVLKCRPPGNRNPLPEEIEACSPFLLGQLERIDPDVIVAFGTFAARTLLETRESLGRLRGRTHLFRGYPVVVTYHPAALLRNPGWTRPTWEDLQRARALADAEGSPRD